MLSRLPGAAFCLVLAGGAGLFFAGRGLAQATRPASKPKTDDRIFKIYHRYVLASRDAARSTQNHRINDVVLRYGNANWGLDRLKAKHGWGGDLDSASQQQIVQDPETHVPVEGEAAAEDGHGVPSPVTLAGELHDAGEYVSAPVRTFSIGTPDEACGGRLRLSPSVFTEAILSTFDGNDFFLVRIRLNDLRILIQDEASGSA